MIRKATLIPTILLAASALAVGWMSVGRAVPDKLAEAPPTRPEQPQPPSAASLEIEIDGVSCASCDLTIRRALKQLDGILAVSAGASKARLIVDYEASKVSPERIVAAINATGFSAKPVSG